MRDYNHPASRKLHLGTSGIGKSTDFVRRLRKEKAKYIFIFDHKREFSQKLGLPVVETLPQLAVATSRGGFILFNHQFLFPGDRAAGWRFFCNFVYTVSENLHGRKILVGDELQQVAGPDDDCEDFIMCMDDGRSFKIDFMGIAQSSNGVHNLVRNQLTEMFVFRQSDDNAIKHLKQNGFDESKVRNLRPGEWLWRNLNTGSATGGGRAFQIHSTGNPDGSIAGKG
jgi:hypothetical protein